MTSARTDGRGHWPKGKPRSELRPGVLDALRAVLSYSSYRQVAAALGTDSRTVHRWATGARRPAPDWQKAILRLPARLPRTPKPAT